MYFDSISDLSLIGIRTPFTQKEAMERLGEHYNFSNSTPTPAELTKALMYDSRLEVVGRNRGTNLYDWVVE